MKPSGIYFHGEAAERLVSASDAARRLGVSRTRVNQLLKAGKLAGAFKIGCNWAIPIEALDAYRASVPAR